jgi:hypothetical protein
MTTTMDGKPLQDIDIICVECNRKFTFSVGEQQFYADRGFVNRPKRCGSCRKHRKDGYAAREAMLKHGAPDGPRR